MKPSLEIISKYQNKISNKVGTKENWKVESKKGNQKIYCPYFKMFVPGSI